MLDQAAVLERRRQILRVVLLVIIFGTLPFYCLGFFLLATAPDRSPREDGLPTATFTLIGGNVIVTPTQFPTLSLTLGTIPTLLRTPFQFNPPIINPPTATWFLSATPIIFIPSSTFAWVYVQPTIGAGFRFGVVDVPFSGFTEVPIGVAWKATDTMTLVAGGGFAIPFNGGYLGIAGAWRW